MALMDRRVVYRPFEYPKADEYADKQKKAIWFPDEVSMASDITDWNSKLSQAEKNVIGNILKGFTQTETIVNDYWSRRVTKWFPKPEVHDMAVTFAAFEGIHAKAYARLNESLGLEDYEAFLSDPSTKAKIDNLVDLKIKSKRDIAKSLAVFSAFTEGVSLFSSFAILLNFSRFDKLKGVGQIIKWSVRDESLHSEAGCWLFRQLIAEYPDLWDNPTKKEVYEAARTAVELEDAFIDKVFELGAIEGLDPKDLKQYIRYRANTKLYDLTLKSNWKNIDQDAVNRITSWFDVLASGRNHDDFFVMNLTDYSRNTVDWNKMYDEDI